MVFERYSRRQRWIVGCLAVNIAVVIMLLIPPPRLVDFVFGQNAHWTNRSNKKIIGHSELKNTTDPVTQFEDITTSLIKPFSPTNPPQPAESMFTYVEEPPVNDELKRFMRALSTQGAVCADLRRVGGSPVQPQGDPRPMGPDGMWYVCFDEEVNLIPGSCLVYSFGIGDDFSFDEKMAQFGCNVSAFDPSMGKEDHMHSPRVMFYNLALSNMNQERNESVLDPLNKSAWKSRTLARIMRELGHSQREIDILKIDIESDEWKCLRHMLTDGTLKSHVRQLNVEYHLTIYTPEALRQYYSIAKWLERQGFRMIHSRRNPYCYQCWEMSYINSVIVNLPLN